MRVNPWKNVFGAFTQKEMIETMKSMKMILLLSVLTANLLQFVTIQSVMKLNISSQLRSLQLGSAAMYMSVIIILFMGHTLINRFFYEERRNRTTDVLLATGMDKTAIWASKMAVTVGVCLLVMIVSLLFNYLFVWFYYRIHIRFNAVSSILTFITMPFLCFGVLSLISAAYWYFADMSVFGMVFPIVTYLGIWNLSIKLVEFFPPVSLLAVSLIIGVFLFGISYLLIRRIPKERIINVKI